MINYNMITLELHFCEYHKVENTTDFNKCSGIHNQFKWLMLVFKFWAWIVPLQFILITGWPKSCWNN